MINVTISSICTSLFSLFFIIPFRKRTIPKKCSLLKWMKKHWQQLSRDKQSRHSRANSSIRKSGDHPDRHLCHYIKWLTTGSMNSKLLVKYNGGTHFSIHCDEYFVYALKLTYQSWLRYLITKGFHYYFYNFLTVLISVSKRD